eukprot:Pgem_evm1s4879
MEDNKTRNINQILPWQSYFHGSISRGAADKLLTNKAFGSFLFRASSQDGSYVLCVVANNNIPVHVKLLVRNGCYSGGRDQPYFSDFDQFILYYKTNPLQSKGPNGQFVINTYLTQGEL